ncbi:hypothetical protein [Streptomyces sp. RPT161]|uniref:hypothetical protein n=1 Tax=Streptomyces sp. RPT161 TaxID=3015993 RepID=UPI0022B8C368|nr:hypothetical protein [Streptomyces sp. RPT161]
MPITRAPRRAAATVAAFLLPLGLAAPAGAAPDPVGGETATVAQSPDGHTSGKPSSALDRVADFYGAYVDARNGDNDTSLTGALRRHYLSQALRDRLATWEEENRADGVLRAQNAPRGWRVSYAGAGDGQSIATVRLAWGSTAHPTYTYLRVRTTLSTMRISDIDDAPDH